MIEIPVYPLQWPEGVKRTAMPSTTKPFKTQLTNAISNVRDSLRRFGQDTGLPINSTSIVFSSNFGAVGLEARETRPKDAGVAVWFEWDKQLRCIAVDRYNDLAQNVQAIHHLIEADRTKMRYGGLEIVRAAYRGLVALPSPETKRHWREVLELTKVPGLNISKATVENAYRSLAQQRHPDKPTGSDAMMAELNEARAQALAEIG